MNRITQFIIKHRWFSALYAMVGLFFPFTNWMSMIVVSLVTLRRGARSGFWIVLASSFAVFLLGIVIPKLGWGVLVVNVLFGTLLIWGLACVLRETQSWSFVLTLTMLAGFLAVGVVHWFDPNVIAHRQVIAEGHLKQLLGMTNNAQTITPQMQAAFDVMMKMMIGLFSFMVLGSVLLCLLAARWMQARAFNPGGLKPELHAIHINLIDLSMLMLIGVLTFFKVTVAIDMLPVLILPFVFAGTASVHRLLQGKRFNKQLLVAYYILLGTLLVQMIMFATILSIVDYVRQIRGKYDGSHLIRKNP